MVWKIILIYLLLINIIAFITYGVDKKKAVSNEWRIQEKTLIGLSILGGGIGSLLGMIVWHHKTRKPAFMILVPLFMVVWVILIVFLLRERLFC